MLSSDQLSEDNTLRLLTMCTTTASTVVQARGSSHAVYSDCRLLAIAGHEPPLMDSGKSRHMMLSAHDARGFAIKLHGVRGQPVVAVRRKTEQGIMGRNSIR